jgi:hypothetical protein
MFKLTVTLIALAAAAPVHASDEFERTLDRISREQKAREQQFWSDVAAGDARADRMAAEAEASARANAQQRALDSINMQLYQLNTR